MFHKRLPDLVTGQVHSNIHQNHSPSPWDVISDQYVTQISIPKKKSTKSKIMSSWNIF